MKEAIWSRNSVLKQLVHIRGLLEEEHHLHRALLDDLASTSRKAAYSIISEKVQQIMCQMQDIWLIKKADEIQLFADHEDMKNF